MTTMISEVYEAFLDAGAKPDKATAAAKAIAGKDSLATKEDLLKVRSELKEDINLLDKKIDSVLFELKQDILKLENKILLGMGGMFIVAISVLAVLMKIFPFNSP